jgi:acyl dehydratase
MVFRASTQLIRSFPSLHNRLSRLRCPNVNANDGSSHQCKSGGSIRSTGDAAGTKTTGDDATVVVRGSIPAGGIGVAVGQFAETERFFTVKDIDLFGRLVCDRNPLHRAWEFENLPSVMDGHPLVKKNDEEPESTMIIVHGLLVSSLFSCIFGTLIPGAVYLKQSLDFRKPVYVNSGVIGRVTITRIRRYRRKGLILTCDTIVFAKGNGNEEKLRGEAEVWLPNGQLFGEINNSTTPTETRT